MLVKLKILLVWAIAAIAQMPLPFEREMYLTDPPMTGDDVIILQKLLNRASVSQPLKGDGVYTSAVQSAVSQLQSSTSDLENTDIFDPSTAQYCLNKFSNDGIVDNGFAASDWGYKYKIHVPVYTNRSIETQATLFDANNNVLHTFTVRAHGKRDDGESYPWPDWGSEPGDEGLNQFSSGGATPTGIMAVDLNSPEPNPEEYGPYPINRVVKGLRGNAELLLPYIRDGILMHTGEWSSPEHPWDSSMPMPNSLGCMHGHPEDIKKVSELLQANGVVVNDNPFSGKDYPYAPQGVLVVEWQAGP
jgi:hypothetical protein